MQVPQVQVAELVRRTMNDQFTATAAGDGQGGLVDLAHGEAAVNPDQGVAGIQDHHTILAEVRLRAACDRHRLKGLHTHQLTAQGQTQVGATAINDKGNTAVAEHPVQRGSRIRRIQRDLEVVNAPVQRRIHGVPIPALGLDAQAVVTTKTPVAGIDGCIDTEATTTDGNNVVTC